MRNDHLSLLLDAGALIHEETHPHGQVFQSCRRMIEIGSRPRLPAVVYAQVWRGGPRQHSLRTLKRMCDTLPFTEQTAHDVGLLLRASKTNDVVDATVIVEAVKIRAAVLTSDPRDMTRLAEAVGLDIPIIAV